MGEGEEVKEISDAVSYGLKISRVPAKTYERFLTLAKSEFADDYGMTLKFLMDFYLFTVEWMDLTKGLLGIVFEVSEDEDQGEE